MCFSRCNSRISDCLPTFRPTCICAMTPVDYPEIHGPHLLETIILLNVWPPSLLFLFAHPEQWGESINRKLPVSLPNKHWCLSKFPARRRKSLLSAPVPRQTNPSGEGADKDHVEEMQLQQQQSTQQKENAVSVSKLRLELCLRYILVAASEQSSKGFPACKHFYCTILESGGLLLHRNVVFIYLRIKAWPPCLSPRAAALPL